MKKKFVGVVAYILLSLCAVSSTIAQDVEPQIASGRSQSVIINDKGKVYTFGSGSYGSLGQSSLTHNEIATALTHSNLNGYTIIDFSVSKISTSKPFGLLLASDGTVFSFGDNTYGQLGLGDKTERFDPTPITHDSLSGVKIVDVQAGEEFSVLLSDSGDVYVMGRNNNGYLGIGSTTPDELLVPTKLTHSNLDGYKISQIASGGDHTFLLADNDTLFAFGGNSNGQLGDGTTVTKIAPTIISSAQFDGKTISKMSVAKRSSLFLMADSSVYSWGNFRTGLGQGSLSADITTPTQITHANISGKKFIDISKSEENGFLLDKDGVVYAFGDEESALGLKANSDVLNPTAIPDSLFGGKKITSVSSGPYHTLFLANDGTVFSTGRGSDGELGSRYSGTSIIPMKVDSTNYKNDRIKGIQAAYYSSFLLSNSGKVYTFGGSYSDSTVSYLGRTAKRTIARPTLLSDSEINDKTFTKVAAAGERTFLLTDDGKVYALGLGINGLLGTGDSLNIHTPTVIDHSNIGSKKIVDIVTASNNQVNSSASSHTLLLAEDGTLFGFGDNNAGQLGLGDNDDRAIATEISHSNLSGKTISKIAVGAQNSMVIATDGTVFIWGNGGIGEMGYGNTNNLNVPTEASHVTSLSKHFIAGAIGQGNSVNAYFILIANDSTVYAFGENSDGQLGMGNKTDNFTPTEITSSNISGKKPIKVAAGVKSSMLLMDDGSTYSFGNTHRVGIEGSSFTDKSEPTLLDNEEILGKRITSIAANYEHGLAIMDDGRIFSFGSDVSTLNRLGALGNGLPESGDETPQPISNFNWLTSPIPTTNLTLHLDAGRGLTLSNDSLNTWRDLSDSENDGFQNTLARRAIVADSAINNQRAIRFNGSNSYLTLPTASDLGIQNSDYEMFVVAKSRTSNTDINFLVAGNIEQYELHLNGAAGARFIPKSSTYIDIGSSGDFTDASAHLIYVRASASEGIVGVNRDTTKSTGSTQNSDAGNLYLGVRFDNSYTLDGDIAEVIIYNSVLSENDRASVESYLMKKYAIQNYGELDQNLTGTQGWRLLASPVQDSSFATLLKGRWTQGITGASVTNGTPNVYTWNTSTATTDASNWTAVSDLGASITPGQAALVYVFSDDNGPDVSGDAGFPKTMEVEGVEPQTDQTLSSLLNTNTNGWTLLGNPFKQDVDWDSFTKTNLSNSVYVWDNNSSDWKTWNGTLGDLTAGEIGAFNGFFVQTTGANPTLQIPTAAKTGNHSRFYGKQSVQNSTPWASLKLKNETHANEMWVMFSDDAELGFDNLDALKLAPLSSEYVLLAAKVSDSLMLDINALPFSTEELSIPIHYETTSAGTHHIELSGFEMPEDWTLQLLDTKLNISTDLIEDYEFEVEAKSKKKRGVESVLNTPKVQQVENTDSTETRFILVIRPGEAVSNEGFNDLPVELELQQNYPNPFNPVSVIEFGLPRNSAVTLQVFDVLGRKVADLISGDRMEAGRYAIRFDGSNLASGMYIYRLKMSDKVLTKKMTLIK